MLEIRNLYAGYQRANLILKGINLIVDTGKVLGDLGRNGSGKSTLAKAICGILPYITGDILFNGISLTKRSSYEISSLGIGHFYQGGRIFPNLSVKENIVFAARTLDRKEIDQRICDLSEWFEILQKSDRLKLKASYLSGGEKHQLALAMVLMLKPSFLLLDEPSAGLSPTNQSILYNQLEKIRSSTVLTIMIIEQNIQLALKFSDDIITLQNGVAYKYTNAEHANS